MTRFYLRTEWFSCLQVFQILYLLVESLSEVRKHPNDQDSESEEKRLPPGSRGRTDLSACRSCCKQSQKKKLVSGFGIGCVLLSGSPLWRRAPARLGTWSISPECNGWWDRWWNRLERRILFAFFLATVSTPHTACKDDWHSLSTWV